MRRRLELAVRSLRGWLREPLLQFLVAGLALFVGYQALDRVRGPSREPGRIELTEDDLRQISIG